MTGLSAPPRLGFAPYASFIMANPGWPGEDRMRRLAETDINPDIGANGSRDISKSDNPRVQRELG